MWDSNILILNITDKQTYILFTRLLTSFKSDAALKIKLREIKKLGRSMYNAEVISKQKFIKSEEINVIK